MRILALLCLTLIAKFCSAGCCGKGSKNSITLDLSNIDESKINVLKGGKNGVDRTDYFAKSDHISSVVDGDKELWKAAEGTNEKCAGVRSYKKGDTSFLYITIKKGDNFEYNFFEKLGGEWKSSKEDEFKDKVDKMMEIPEESVSKLTKPAAP